MPAPSQSTPPPYKLCPRCRLIYPAVTNFCGRDREPLVSDSRIIAGRYILQNQVGSGAMSEVYAAEQPQLGRKVAIKLLRRDLDVVRRFYSEVRAVGQIRHEHVVTIHDSGRIEDGRPYIAMEYLEGEDLASHLKRHGPMQSSRAMLLWRQAVSAVAAAHRRHVVHRDIKPANLFLTYREGDEGPEEIIKVIDFSIAKLDAPGSDSRPTEPGAIVGTVLYMAPEQLARSEATPRSDVYSLGLVLMEMLTGKLPWGGAGGDVVKVGHALQRLVHSPSTLRELDPEQLFSEELQQLASAVLSQEPAHRPADAGELLRRIKQLPEMRDWQRIPRRLTWSGAGEPTPQPESARVREAVLADPTAKLTELPTRKPPVVPSVPRSQPELITEQDGSPFPGDSARSASGSLTEIGAWSEEPVPAEGALLEQHMRSLEVALFAESRRAQNAGVDFSADTFSPVPPSSLAPSQRAEIPSQRSQRDDSSSRSKVNVFSATDLNNQLDAVPEFMGEEPTIPSSGPLVQVESPPEVNQPTSQASRSPVVQDELRPPSKTTAQVPRRRPAQRGWMSSLALGLAIILLIRLLYLEMERLFVPVNKKPSTNLPATVLDLRMPDEAASGERDASTPVSSIVDLSAPPDLEKAVTDRAAEVTPHNEAKLIRVRLFYNEDDGINELTCTPPDAQAKTTTNQQGRVTLRTILRPGAVCTVSGPGGTQSYTYDQLARHHAQRSGEIRFHVQGGAAPSPAPTPARPVRISEPLTVPQAAESSEPVDGG